jgi:hypothetical protein
MASNNPKKSLNKLQGIQRGIDQFLVGSVTMTFRGQQAGASVMGPLAAGYAGNYTGVSANLIAWKQSIATRDAQQPTVEQFFKDCEAGVVATWGEDSEQYQAFGFTSRKKPIELTHEQKDQKVQKMRATRAARKTMGKRQKQAVKGVVAPIVPPSSPSSGNVTAPKSP